MALNDLWYLHTNITALTCFTQFLPGCQHVARWVDTQVEFYIKGLKENYMLQFGYLCETLFTSVFANTY